MKTFDKPNGVPCVLRRHECGEGVALIEVQDKILQKAAACLAEGIHFAFDNEHKICEKYEEAGIVPFHIRNLHENPQGRVVPTKFLPQYKALTGPLAVPSHDTFAATVGWFLEAHNRGHLVQLLQCVQTNRTEFFDDETAANRDLHRGIGR